MANERKQRNGQQKRKPVSAKQWAARQPVQLRHFESRPFSQRKVPPYFRQFVLDELIPLLPLKAKYRIREIHELAVHCIHNLVTTGMAQMTVGDSRGTSKRGVSRRVGVWDAIENAGFAESQSGSELSECTTRYSATAKLMEHFSDWPLHHIINMKLIRNSAKPNVPEHDALIVLKCDKEVASFPEEHLASQIDTDFGTFTVRECLESEEDSIEGINRENLRHSWQVFRQRQSVTGEMKLTACDVCVSLKRIYSGTLFRYGRLYTIGEGKLSAQNLSKEERKRVLIDGEQAAELDYGSLHIRMLYHQLGKTLHGDAYRPWNIIPIIESDDPMEAAAFNGLLRKFVKVAVNACLNAESRRQAEQSVANQLYDFNGKSEFSHASRKFLLAVMEAAAMKTKDIINRIVSTNSRVAHRFFVGYGASLQTMDGILMLRILRRLTSEGIPVLGIHDSVLCRLSDVERVEHEMCHSYMWFFGMQPEIRREF